MPKTTAEAWLANRPLYLKGLTKPNDSQVMLMHLATKSDRSKAEERTLLALTRAEKLTVEASEARVRATSLLNSAEKAAKEAARKSRNHELYLSAGLLSLAGLVDKESGKPRWDKGELLGTLMEIAGSLEADPRRAGWKSRGDARLAQSSSEPVP